MFSLCSRSSDLSSNGSASLASNGNSGGGGGQGQTSSQGYGTCSASSASPPPPPPMAMSTLNALEPSALQDHILVNGTCCVYCLQHGTHCGTMFFLVVFYSWNTLERTSSGFMQMIVLVHVTGLKDKPVVWMPFVSIPSAWMCPFLSFSCFCCSTIECPWTLFIFKFEHNFSSFFLIFCLKQSSRTNFLVPLLPLLNAL